MVVNNLTTENHCFYRFLTAEPKGTDSKLKYFRRGLLMAENV